MSVELEKAMFERRCQIKTGNVVAQTQVPININATVPFGRRDETGNVRLLRLLRLLILLLLLLLTLAFIFALTLQLAPRRLVHVVVCSKARPSLSG